jgi:type 1 glutamine amidotransferase
MSGRLLAITGGHRFDHGAFMAVLADVCARLGWEFAHAEQPAAQSWLQPRHAGAWSAVLLHDIPGLTLERGAEPQPHDPPTHVRDGVRALLDAGQGIVATHHALAGWPTWDEWAEVLGGRFCYTPGHLRGRPVPASGYRMDTYPVEIVARDHPVCAGLDSFELTDELYLCPVFEHEVVPLLRTTADVSAASMIDTYREVRHGERVPATEQQGSDLLAWARTIRRSRVVYLLPGHGPQTMSNESYRRLLANSLAWVANRDHGP